MEEIHQMSHMLQNVNSANRMKFVSIAKVRHFSNQSIHRPGEEVLSHSERRRWFRGTLSLSLYANGINSENKGYISLRFSITSLYYLPLNEYSEFSCFVSIIDSSGNKRFLRSFIFPYCHEWRNFFNTQNFDINRYIKRETLLSDTLDLLPEDCLSLHIDGGLTMINSVNKLMFDVDDAMMFSFTSQIRDNKIKGYLSLDSAVAERLKAVSTYFRRMSESEMEEQRTGYMNVPADESKSFARICRILLGSEAIAVHSIHDICLMYILADKYDIPVAIETCRRLMVGFLREKNDETIAQHVDESIPEMLELAERFNDVRLKEIVESFLNYKEEGIENGNRTREDKQDNLETEWWVRVEGRIPGIHAYAEENVLLFHLSKGVKMWCQDKHEFEFYR